MRRAWSSSSRSQSATKVSDQNTKNQKTKIWDKRKASFILFSKIWTTRTTLSVPAIGVDATRVEQLLKKPQRDGRRNWGAEGHLPPPQSKKVSYPYSNQGADYTHHITTYPTGFLDLPSVLGSAGRTTNESHFFIPHTTYYPPIPIPEI